MIDGLSVTQILAVLLGLYFMSAGVGLITKREIINGMIEALLESPMLAYLGGVVVFAIGGAMVSVHNQWDGLLQGFVSFVGWAALVEGILLLACSQWFLGIFKDWRISPGFATVLGGFTAVFGGLLVFSAIGT